MESEKSRILYILWTDNGKPDEGAVPIAIGSCALKLFEIADTLIAKNDGNCENYEVHGYTDTGLCSQEVFKVIVSHIYSDNPGFHMQIAPVETWCRDASTGKWMPAA